MSTRALLDADLFDDDLLDGPRVKMLTRLGSEAGDYYQNRAFRFELPNDSMPTCSLPKEVAFRLIEDDLTLDGQPRLNLATFVTTHCEREAEELLLQGARKNAIDMDEYPQVKKMEQRCVNMLCRLYNAPLKPKELGTGTACVGSSEAIMLATLAMKWKWKERCRREGRPATNPNIVFGSNVQCCWHKACKYFEVESREAELSEDCIVLTAERCKDLIDENTIGVCPILGSTFNGEYEDVKGIHDVVMQLNQENGWDIPIHVDAASGGFVAPFMTPELEWDFRLPLVKSINVSGHKFGLVYAGIGWLLFREKEDLHEDLVFHVNYLGGDQASFTLNFSKGSGNIIVQYYNLVRLGRTGYTQILRNCMANAAYLREGLVATGKFGIVDKGHLPLVSWRLLDESLYTVFDIQDKLRHRGWIVPAYNCPQGAEDMAIMRVVVKENFGRSLAEMLLEDILKAIGFLEKNPTKMAKIKQDSKMREIGLKRRVSMREGDSRSAAIAKEELSQLLTTTDILCVGHDPTHRMVGDKTHAVC